MAMVETLIGPIASLLDRLIPDKEARERAKLELLQLEGTQELRAIEARLGAIVAEARKVRFITALPASQSAKPSCRASLSNSGAGSFTGVRPQTSVA